MSTTAIICILGLGVRWWHQAPTLFSVVIVTHFSFIFFSREGDSKSMVLSLAFVWPVCPLVLVLVLKLPGSREME